MHTRLNPARPTFTALIAFNFIGISWSVTKEERLALVTLKLINPLLHRPIFRCSLKQVQWSCRNMFMEHAHSHRETDHSATGLFCVNGPRWSHATLYNAEQAHRPLPQFCIFWGDVGLNLHKQLCETINFQMFPLHLQVAKLAWLFLPTILQ